MTPLASQIRPDPCTCRARCKPKNGRPPSRALFVAFGGKVHLLAYIGCAIDWEIESVGHDAVLDGWDEDGVWVWSGRLQSWRSYEGEYDCELVTETVEPPTPEEWAAWVSGEEHPWDETEEEYYEPGDPCPVHGGAEC